MPAELGLALALLPDFSLILLGASLRRLLHLGDHFWNGLEKLVYYVLFPALLFNGLLKAQIAWSSAAPMLAVAGAAMGGSMLLGLVARMLPITPLSFASQYQCAFRFNSYIGLAVAGTLHGLPGIAAMGIVVGLMVPPANVVAVWMLARHGEVGVLRELVRNPLILATLAGIAANLVGLEPPATMLKFLGRLGDAAIVLGLLAVGAGLRIVGAGGTATHAAAAYFLLVKLLAMPAIALLLIRAFGLSGVHADVALIFAALPAASSAYILAQRMGGDGARVAWLISAGTLASMISIPLWLGLR
ncbi:MAG: AEC family transporter [Rhodocyclales bacterium]|nr:AEC family transporter [Rhodocyclales bacterium]